MPPKPQSEHEAGTEQASRTNVSGQCEVIAKCERMIELPPSAARKRQVRKGTEKRRNGIASAIKLV